jgi:hypothetical protein
VNEQPVSWLLIEEGWEVVGSDGQHVGKVDEVEGEGDIFSGLLVSTHLFGKPRMISADQVAEIDEGGRIHLSISSSNAKRLPEHEPPDPAA